MIIIYYKYEKYFETSEGNHSGMENCVWPASVLFLVSLAMICCRCFFFVYPGWIPRCNLLVQTDFSNSTGNSLGNFASERNLSHWIVSFISIFSWLAVFAHWIQSLLLVFQNIKVISSQLFLCCFHLPFHPFIHVQYCFHPFTIVHVYICLLYTSPSPRDA